MQIEILALRQAQNSRPFALGDHFPFLEAMALSADNRQTGNSDSVAPKRISFVLVLEE
jgi:hypothetical protein